jgi:hypothetical protein
VTGKVLHGKAEQAENPDKRGQSADTRINTAHQGRQQDRQARSRPGLLAEA